jgi:hypothetical protein
MFVVLKLRNAVIAETFVIILDMKMAPLAVFVETFQAGAGDGGP